MTRASGSLATSCSSVGLPSALKADQRSTGHRVTLHANVSAPATAALTGPCAESSPCGLRASQTAAVQQLRRTPASSRASADATPLLFKKHLLQSDCESKPNIVRVDQAEGIAASRYACNARRPPRGYIHMNSAQSSGASIRSKRCPVRERLTAISTVLSIPDKNTAGTVSGQTTCSAATIYSYLERRGRTGVMVTGEMGGTSHTKSPVDRPRHPTVAAVRALLSLPDQQEISAPWHPFSRDRANSFVHAIWIPDAALPGYRLLMERFCPR